MATVLQVVDEQIRQRALVLERSRIKALDALHVACAEAAGAQFFVTCDDRLIRRYRELASKVMATCDPTEFVRLVSSV
jgi:predicted nucleic acid-binding protein